MTEKTGTATEKPEKKDAIDEIKEIVLDAHQRVQRFMDEVGHLLDPPVAEPAEESEGDGEDPDLVEPDPDADGPVRHMSVQQMIDEMWRVEHLRDGDELSFKMSSDQWWTLRVTCSHRECRAVSRGPVDFEAGFRVLYAEFMKNHDLA